MDLFEYEVAEINVSRSRSDASKLVLLATSESQEMARFSKMTRKPGLCPPLYSQNL